MGGRLIRWLAGCVRRGVRGEVARDVRSVGWLVSSLIDDAASERWLTCWMETLKACTKAQPSSAQECRVYAVSPIAAARGGPALLIICWLGSFSSCSSKRILPILYPPTHTGIRRLTCMLPCLPTHVVSPTLQANTSNALLVSEQLRSRQARAMSASFRRIERRRGQDKTPAPAASAAASSSSPALLLRAPGARPWVNGQSLVSSGNRDLDGACVHLIVV